MPRRSMSSAWLALAEWVAKHGDPRDPKVDAVDWVERIPFAETRNYVQRVMENTR
jgi:soluble lytic murein transglycosylase